MTIGGRHTFGCVNMRDFLSAMAKAVKPNSTAWDNFQRMYVPAAEVPQSAPNSPLRTNILFKHVQVTVLVLQLQRESSWQFVLFALLSCCSEESHTI